MWEPWLHLGPCKCVSRFGAQRRDSVIQDGAASPGTWFGDTYRSQEEKWQGLELPFAYFAVELNKQNSMKSALRMITDMMWEKMKMPVMF